VLRGTGGKQTIQAAMATVLPSEASHGRHSHDPSSAYSVQAGDLDLLQVLASQAGPSLQKHKRIAGRRPQLDPLILETAAASGPR
jgi:hypothetical protein